MAEEYTVSDSKTGKPEHYQDQDVIETSVNTDGRNQYGQVAIQGLNQRQLLRWKELSFISFQV